MEETKSVSRPAAPAAVPVSFSNVPSEHDDTWWRALASSVEVSVNTDDDVALLVELVPGARVVWCCSSEDYRGGRALWKEHAARTFDEALAQAKCERRQSPDGLSSPDIFPNGVYNGSVSIHQRGSMLRITDHFAETAGQNECAGYIFDVPLERYIGLLAACAERLHGLARAKTHGSAVSQAVANGSAASQSLAGPPKAAKCASPDPRRIQPTGFGYVTLAQSVDDERLRQI